MFGSKDSLKDIVFDGKKKFKLYNNIEYPKFPKGKLGVKSSEVILEILESFPNIMKISFKNNRLPDYNIGKAISYANAKNWITQISFENNYEKSADRWERGQTYFLCCKIPKWAYPSAFSKGFTQVADSILDKANSQASMNLEGNKLLKKIATVKCMLSAYERSAAKNVLDDLKRDLELNEMRLRKEEQKKKRGCRT